MGFLLNRGFVVPQTLKHGETFYVPGVGLYVGNEAGIPENINTLKTPTVTEIVLPDANKMVTLQYNTDKILSCNILSDSSPILPNNIVSGPDGLIINGITMNANILYSANFPATYVIVTYQPIINQTLEISPVMPIFNLVDFVYNNNSITFNNGNPTLVNIPVYPGTKYEWILTKPDATEIIVSTNKDKLIATGLIASSIYNIRLKLTINDLIFETANVEITLPA